jgi:23S rRNA-/tRNA-specific pseudouridylate synthase
MEKIYHTIVLGIPPKRQDTIRARLLRIENAKNEAKVKVDETGQSAVTHYTVVQDSKLVIQNNKNQP